MSTIANDALLESWQLHLHDKAAGTRQLYLKHATSVLKWLADNDRNADLLEIRRPDLEAWFAALGAAGLAQATRRSRWIALRSLFGWLVDAEERDDNPMTRIRVERPDEPPPPVLNLADIKAMLKACEGREFADRRDTAILRTFLATGARRAEVANLEIDDVDLRSRVITITRGKGGRARVVRIDAATAAAIDRYRRARARHRTAEQPWMWLGQKGRLTASGIVAALDRRATAAGVDKFHVHLLRHWWAHQWQARGGNESSLQVLGGWQDTSTMRRYGAALRVDRALDHYDDLGLLEDL